MQHIRPQLQVLTSEQINALHRYSVQILEHTGIRVDCPDATKTFKTSGAVSVQNDRVFIRQEIIEEAIGLAPSNIDVYRQSGELAFTLGEKQGQETYFGIGVTNTHFQEVLTNDVVPFRREHTQVCAQMGDQLEHFDMISTLGTPSDVPVQLADLYATLDLYTNTDKPLVLLMTESANLEAGLSLITHLHGDPTSKPFCIPYVNPITPLVLNKATTDKIQVSIRYQQPLMFSNYSLYGATTPMSEGGTLALLNAELLAGLVYTQLLKPGSPVILGSLPAAFSMETMRSQYTPISYLLNVACAEMMAHYKIPHCGTSGSNNGWGPDLLAAGDLWQNHLTSCMGKVGCAPFVGGTFDSIAFSPGLIVLSNEIIGAARTMARGFSLDEAQADLNELHQLGPGGNFFTSTQTLAAFSKAQKKSVWPALTLDRWLNKDKPAASDYLAQESESMYAAAKKLSMEKQDTLQKGEAYIACRKEH